MVKLFLYNFCYCFLLLVFLSFFSCKDSDSIGLEVQPTSDRIEIFETSFDQHDQLASLTISTDTVSPLRSDETSSLLLGGIMDPVFGFKSASFSSQISLSESNIDLGNNPLVDSVVFSYSYSGYYGDLSSFDDAEVYFCSNKIYKDSVYYSNYDNSSCYDLINGSLLSSFEISSDTSLNPSFKMTLSNSIGQQILDMGNDGFLIDNQTFQDNFGFFVIKPYSTFSHSPFSNNVILYLNPSGSNTGFTVYYHNDSNDSLELNFLLDGETARINTFSPSLPGLTPTAGFSYIQSMAGHKSKIVLEIDSIAEELSNKALNKVTLSFDVEDNSLYPAHENLSLVRVDSAGNNIFLSDLIAEGTTHFGGDLVDGSYEFNITRYFYNLLNDPYFTDELYLLASGAAINANRTIIDNSSIKIIILYSDL